MYQAPRGTTDILPDEQPIRRYIEQKAAEACRRYGYERIDTPVFEDTGLFVRGIGQGTDIVSREMYSFTDKGGNSITLRPEGTAPVCRAYIEHGMHNLPQPVKLYYLAPIFRYERPQSGRLRQHHQFGFEAIGDADASVDAEVIDMAWRFYAGLGLSNLKLLLNSLGCSGCRPGYVTRLKLYYLEHQSDLCPDCKLRLERNTLRLLDCKREQCQPLAAGAPSSADYLCAGCGGHFGQLNKHLATLKLPVSLEHRLVRGLDYYTRTVFEIQPRSGGAMSTIGGGGRYDDLIQELGGRPTPAVGFATGIERIILNLKEQSVAIPPIPKPQVFVAPAQDSTRNEAFKLTSELRQAGIAALLGPAEKSLKAQLRQANSLGVRFAVIIGEEEMKAGTVILRDMVSASQETVGRGDVVGRVDTATP